MSILDRTIPPAVLPLESFSLPEAASYTLASSVPIHILPSHHQDVVRTEFVWKAGHYFERTPGQALICSKAMSEGTKSYLAAEIAETIASLGGYFEISEGYDRLSLTVVCRQRFLQEILGVVVEMFSESIFPPKNMEQVRNILLQQYKVNAEKTGYMASAYLREHLFGSTHAYGYTMHAQAISDFDMSKAQEHYRDYIKTGDMEVFVAGNISEDHISLFDDLLKEYSYRGVTYHTAYGDRFPNVTHKLYEKPGSVQSSLRLGRRMFTRNHPEYIKMLVANEVLGGYFGSRLMKNIREDKGLTYGIYSQLITLQKEGYFVVGADVKLENTKLALQEIYKEIKILGEEPVSLEELDTVKNYMIGQFLASINTPFQVMDKFKSIHFAGMGYDFYHQYIDQVKKCTSADVSSMVQKYLSPDQLTEVVVGGV